MTEKTKHYPHRKIGAAASARSRSDMSKKTIRAVVDHLKRNPGLWEQGSIKVSLSLNEAGIKTALGRAWTASSVRGQKRKIEKELQTRAILRIEMFPESNIAGRDI